ncbi:MAG TPA: hypothetical protein V6C72_01805 [Chroococcales cyanobacterium]
MKRRFFKVAVSLSTICASLYLAPHVVLADPATIGAASASIVSLDEKASPGEKVTLKLSAAPGTRCSIEAQGSSLLDVASLRPKSANNEGILQWTWQIPRSYKAQSMPVIVTIEGQGEQEKLLTEVCIKGATGPKLTITNAAQAAKRGQLVEVAAKTIPNSKCHIEVQGAALPDSLDMVDRRADTTGTVSWTFHIPAHYKADKLPVIVTSGVGGKETKAFAAIDVRQFTAARKGAEIR